MSVDRSVCNDDDVVKIWMNKWIIFFSFFWMTGLQACAVKTTTTFYVRKHIYGKRIESKIIRKEKKKGSNPLSLSLSLWRIWDFILFFIFFFVCHTQRSSNTTSANLFLSSSSSSWYYRYLVKWMWILKKNEKKLRIFFLHHIQRIKKSIGIQLVCYKRMNEKEIFEKEMKKIKKIVVRVFAYEVLLYHTLIIFFDGFFRNFLFCFVSMLIMIHFFCCFGTFLLFHCFQIPEWYF